MYFGYKQSLSAASPIPPAPPYFYSALILLEFSLQEFVTPKCSRCGMEEESREDKEWCSIEIKRKEKKNGKGT